MFIARIVFFRLHESPRFLVHAGRPEEAMESLQLISRFNGEELDLGLEDIEDVELPPTATNAGVANDAPKSDDSSTTATLISHTVERSEDALRDPAAATSHYNTMSEPDVALDAHSFGTPLPPPTARRLSAASFDPSHLSSSGPPSLTPSNTAPFLQRVPSAPELSAQGSDLPPPRPRPLSTLTPGSRRMSRRLSTASSYVESKSGGICKALPRWVRRPLLAWIDRIAMVLSPEWIRTTLLVWAAWWAMSLGKSGYLCAVLACANDGRSVHDVQRIPTETARDTFDLDRHRWCAENAGRQLVGRCHILVGRMSWCDRKSLSHFPRPSSRSETSVQLGAWLIDSRLGRRWSLAGSTFVTAFFCWVFVVVEHPWAVRASTVGISLSATVSTSLQRVFGLLMLTKAVGDVGGAVWMDARNIRDER